ncbi:hypothetical protein NHX12_014282 [Muraenolepis orangiensis]|uniref:C2H2-type domain-containing protein n=1 Tax=Muraenolepis orangiensis TaxID=630683 RepID=A0A9Q0DBP1_9TELE|nr:hypothetical protein NHX12_014282 [Muraenolepis orangiensis]
MEDPPASRQQAHTDPPHHHYHHQHHHQHHHQQNQHHTTLNRCTLTRLQSPGPGYGSSSSATAACKPPLPDPLPEPAGCGTDPSNAAAADRDGPSGEGPDVAAGRPGEHLDARVWDGRGGSCGSSAASEFYGQDDYGLFKGGGGEEEGGERDVRDRFDSFVFLDGVGDEPSYERWNADGYDAPYEPVYDERAAGAFHHRGGHRRSGPDQDPGPGQSCGEGVACSSGGGRRDGWDGDFQGRRYEAQRLDSFSEAFRAYGRRGFPGYGTPSTVPGRSSDTYLPSLPSPPHLSQLLTSLLSPPPTPLPPPCCPLSPTLPPHGDGPPPFGTSAWGLLPVRREVEAVQLFPRGVPPPSHRRTPAGVIWKLPGLPRSCDPRAVAEGNLGANHGDAFDGPPDHQRVPMAPESSFISCSPLTPSSSSSSPSFTSSFPTPLSPLHHPPHPPSHLPSAHQGKQEGRGASCTPEAQEGHGASCTPEAQEVQSGSPSQSYPKNGTPSTYRGTTFPSMLHSRGDGQRRGRYTPRPILNPFRQGCVDAPCINVGPDFQAEVPARCLQWAESPGGPAEESSPGERLLWKPFTSLEESVAVQGHVEGLLSMCNSSCLPGGGANTELALHCLHHCHGDTMAALKMLMLSLPTATGDYHYSGSDTWTDQERTVFSEGLRTLGKDFSLMQTMPMRTLLGPERAVPAAPLATFFPCKMCGKMFYKIKSRNAHMKIHRQPQQGDWSDRRLQPQLTPPAGHGPNAPHRLNPPPGPGLCGHLLQPQASPGAFSFHSHSHGHPDSAVLNLCGQNGIGPLMSGFGDVSHHADHLGVSGGDASDSGAANQRVALTAPSPVHHQSLWTLWMG